MKRERNLVLLWVKDVVHASENQGGGSELTASAFNPPSGPHEIGELRGP